MKIRDILKIIISLTTLVLLIFIIYDKFYNIVEDEGTTNDTEEINKQSVEIDLVNALYSKLPNYLYCDEVLMDKIYQSNKVNTDDITTEDYNVSTCDTIYKVNTKRIEAYKVDNIIYIEEYVILYDKNTNMYGTSYDKEFNINYDDIALNNNEITDLAFSLYAKKYIHTFKRNSVGVYNWLSTEMTK